MTYKWDVSESEIINAYTASHPYGDTAGIKHALSYASEKHAGMMRKSGEPYIHHPMRAARLLAERGFESDVLIAALLHDVVEDCDVKISEIRDFFGPDVAEMVDAVTALSDRDYKGQKLTKKQLDNLSDARFQNKTRIRALYVKIADRIDNLSTISGVEMEKRIPKAVHTREILIPMAERANAFYFVDILEELCFRIEHPAHLSEMEKICRELYKENRRTIEKTLLDFKRIFDPLRNNCAKDLDPYHRHIIEYWHQERTMISIYRQITAGAEKLMNMDGLLGKECFAFHDLFLIVSNDLEEKGTPIRTIDLFFKYFELALSGRGLYIVDYRRTTHKDASYFLLADEMDNLYRLFIRTRDEYNRYLYGNIAEDSAFFPGIVNELDPRDTYMPKIKVFCADGTATLINRDATVLDFAFLIHTNLGLHFKYAQLNGNENMRPPYTRLNEGDTVLIVTDENTHPSFSWFKYVYTSRAKDILVNYFTELYTPEQ